MKTKTTIKDIVKIVKIATDFYAQQYDGPEQTHDQYLYGMSHTASELASVLISEMFGINVSDGDTVSEYLKLKPGHFLTEKEITTRLTKYIKSKEFKKMVKWKKEFDRDNL